MNKINTTTILDKYKMLPKCKARMNIPLCKMILMHVICLTLKIDVLKMEHAFHFGYCKVFNDTPPDSMMDSIANPKVKTTKGEGVGTRSLAHNTLRVKGCARVPGWGLGIMTSKSITHMDPHKPNNKLVNA
jgi:hypothetical protein